MRRSENQGILVAVALVVALAVAAAEAFIYGWAYEANGRWGIFWVALVVFIITSLIRGIFED